MYNCKFSGRNECFSPRTQVDNTHTPLILGGGFFWFSLVWVFWYFFKLDCLVLFKIMDLFRLKGSSGDSVVQVCPKSWNNLLQLAPSFLVEFS